LVRFCVKPVLKSEAGQGLSREAERIGSKNEQEEIRIKRPVSALKLVSRVIIRVGKLKIINEVDGILGLIVNFYAFQ